MVLIKTFNKIEIEKLAPPNEEREAMNKTLMFNKKCLIASAMYFTLTAAT